MKRFCIAAVSFLLVSALPSLAQLTEQHAFAELNKAIPDGSASGLSDIQNVTSSIAHLSRVAIKLHIAGQFNGDLYGYVRHSSEGATNFCVLLNRPGRTAAIPQGYPDAGLDVTFDDSAANGDIHNYRDIITPAPGTPLTGVWQPDGRRTDPVAVLDSTVRTTALDSFAGVPARGEWTLFLADLESGGTNLLIGWELELTGATAPEIMWTNPADIIYGTPLGPAQLNASSLVPGTFVYDPPEGTLLDAGALQMLSVTFVPDDSANYLSSTTNVAINVLKKALTITAVASVKVYGAPLPAFTATFDGFVNGESPAVLDAPVVFSTLATQSSDVGSYAIQPSAATGSNYVVDFVGGTLTITPAHTSATLTSFSNPALPGQEVTFVFTASAVPPSVAVPTGDVVFRIDGFSQVVPMVNGAAMLTASTLSAGKHVVQAEFASVPNFLGTTNRLAPDLVINTPPVANPDQIDRYLPNGAKVLINTLLANDTDADADRISFVSVEALSTHGGALRQEGDWLYYTAPSGFTNDDAFTYVITDGYVQVNGRVVLKANSTPPSANLTILFLSDGSYRIRGDGAPGLNYRIEYSDALSLPTWRSLGSFTANDVGSFEAIDTPAAGSGQRFYRSVYP